MIQPGSIPGRRLVAIVAVAFTMWVAAAAPSAAAGVERTPIARDGIVGVLFAPEGRHPGVVVLGGSEGGIPERTAARLAERGFCVLALGYFKAPALRGTLTDIPLEAVSRGFDLLAQQPEVAGKRFGLVGGSKGAELALLAATRDSRAAAVVAIVPSDVVWFGLPDYAAAERNPETSSWTFGGQAVPYVPADVEAGMKLGSVFGTGGFARYRDVYDASRMNARSEVLAAATIPVERIQGPVLAIGGEADAVWDSAGAVRRIGARLAAAHRRYRDQQLTYRDAGHVIVPAGERTVEEIPAGRACLSFGGTHEGNVAASNDSWPRIVDFLRVALDAAPLSSVQPSTAAPAPLPSCAENAKRATATP